MWIQKKQEDTEATDTKAQDKLKGFRDTLNKLWYSCYLGMGRVTEMAHKEVYRTWTSQEKKEKK